MNNILKSLISVDGANGSAGTARIGTPGRGKARHVYNVYRHPADSAMPNHSGSLSSTVARMSIAVAFGLLCWALLAGIAITLFG